MIKYVVVETVNEVDTEWDFDTMEQAVEFFDGYDLRKEWKTEYMTSNNRNTATRSLAIFRFDTESEEYDTNTDFYKEYGLADNVAEIGF